MVFRRALMVALLLAASSLIGAEPEMVLPVGMQMALVANVLKLDYNFDVSRLITIGIVYQQDYRDSVLAKDDVTAAASRLDLTVRCIEIEAGTQEALRHGVMTAAVDVIYVTPLRAVDVAEIAAIARTRSLRTFTGVPSYVEAGLGVGFGMRKNRPLLVINLAGTRAEGAAFSSQLLSLARIVGPQP
jgi:ABC-type uncharacterized transport system substrate-binding protein